MEDGDETSQNEGWLHFIMRVGDTTYNDFTEWKYETVRCMHGECLSTLRAGGRFLKECQDSTRVLVM